MLLPMTDRPCSKDSIALTPLVIVPISDMMFCFCCCLVSRGDQDPEPEVGVVAGVVVEGVVAAGVEGVADDEAAAGGLMLRRFAIGYSAPPMMRFGVAPLVST